MAETKSSESKNPGPTGSTSKTGAVKPPVLDLQAREADREGVPKSAAAPPKPESAKPESSKSESSKPETIKPMPSSVSKPIPAGGFGWGAAILGGVLGLAAAYGLAWFGYWPNTMAALQPDPRLAQFGQALPQLQAVTQSTAADLAELNQRMDGLEQAVAMPIAATPSADLSAVETDIAALTARIDNLKSAPQGNVPSAGLDALKTQLAALGRQVDALGARMGTTEAGMRTLETRMGETSAALAEQPADIGGLLQLPLVVSGLETAFSAGRPFENELAALRTALPTVTVPRDIANGAATGLARPSVIAARFEAAVPAMLAQRPSDPDASWQDGALDWLRSAIVLRPSGEIPGNTPEAVMSRLEGAIERRDYIGAEALMAALPASMQAAAAGVPALIHEQVAAAKFLETLREQAFKGIGSAP